jgi:hypothetical protein
MKVKKATKVGAALHRTKVSVLLIMSLLLNQVCILPATATIAADEIGDVITAGVGRQEVIVREIKEGDVIIDSRPDIILASRSSGITEREPEVIVQEEIIVEETTVEEPVIIEEPVVVEEVIEPEPVVEEVIVEEPEPEPEPVQEPDLDPYANKNNVTEPSNATAEELNRAINSSCKWMREYNTDGRLGEFYYKMEQQYGINAYFALSVPMQEVGVQQASSLARNKNNIYGLRGKNGYLSFSSYEDCIEYWFNMINKAYVGKRGLISVQSISGRYCNGNPEWVSGVSSFMNKLPDRSLI